MYSVMDILPPGRLVSCRADSIHYPELLNRWIQWPKSEIKGQVIENEDLVN